jgi:hypothetical protein
MSNIRKLPHCFVAAAIFVAGCATVPSPSPAEQWFDRLSRHCGKAFEGRLASSDPADSSFAEQHLVMHVRQCSADEFRIPFHVGEDRSRTWVITRTATGLRLKHDHRHQDGTSDVITMYGGDSRGEGTPVRQEFPADAESIAMFTAQGRSVSNTNVWAIEVDERIFAYELRRPPIPGGRFFRVEFDLDRPVTPPPPPWGG